MSKRQRQIHERRERLLPYAVIQAATMGDSKSIQHQKQILEKYAIDHGIGHYEFYVDDGYSGTNFAGVR